MSIIPFQPKGATPTVEWDANAYWDALRALENAVERAWCAETFREADDALKEIELIETSLAIAIRGEARHA